MKTYKQLFFIVLFYCVLSPIAFAHPGRLAGDGCHNDKSTGTRHCHRERAGTSNTPNNPSIPNNPGVFNNPNTPNNPNSSYSRKNWKHWIDLDCDCQDARQEVLIEENIGTLVMSSNGCRVESGEWYDPYTGNTYTNPSDLDIDHYVPLKEAYLSGANKWGADKKKIFANYLSDPYHLIAVYRGANRSKGARDPSEWLPPNADYICEYVKTWTLIKNTWGLSMDPEEIKAIENANIAYQCK